MDHLYNAVAKHRKGDLVSVAGNMQLNQWTEQDGTAQQGYKCWPTTGEQGSRDSY